MRSVLVLGSGVSGRAAAEELQRRGISFLVYDDREPASFDPREQQLELFDTVITSPGFPPRHPLYQACEAAGLPILSEIELACQKFPHNRWLAITGTNGKTTVVEMVAHFLRAAGYSAEPLGNVGVPISSQSFSEERIIVAELSSFQIEKTFQRVFDAALLLNITPDHLDHHGSFEAYAKAKLGLSRCLREGAPFYLHEDLQGSWSCPEGAHFFGYRRENRLSTDGVELFWRGECLGTLPMELQYRRNHHVENFLAALALCLEQGVAYEVIERAYPYFRRPPHRIEIIGVFDGITVIDDSKGTNLDAVKRAVQGLDGPLWIIVGGVHKGSSYREWIPAFSGKVKKLLAIGAAAKLIEEELQTDFPVVQCGTLDIAVRHARQEMQPGETLLLSPGCASYDQFSGYADRGRQFQKIVVENFSRNPAHYELT